MNKIQRLFSGIGFCGLNDLLNSLIKPKIAIALFSFSSIATFIDFVFGIKPFLFIALLVILITELLSGLLASKLKKRKITSRRMQRFGIMIMIWGTLLMIMNALIFQYKGTASEHVAYYMHTTVVFYIVGVYVKSIMENAQVIWSNKLNAKEFIQKLFKISKS